MEISALPQGNYHFRAKEGCTEQVEMSGIKETDLEVREQWTQRGYPGTGLRCKKTKILVVKSWHLTPWSSCCFTIHCFLSYDPRWLLQLQSSCLHSSKVWSSENLTSIRNVFSHLMKCFSMPFLKIQLVDSKV